MKGKLFGFVFAVFFIFFLLIFKDNVSANNCAVGQAQICSPTFKGSSTSQLCTEIKFNPPTPAAGNSVTATVWAYNAQRVDVDLFTPSGDKGTNGISCSGTTCSFTFTPQVTGTYKVNYNAWDICGGVVHNHEAYNLVNVKSSGPTATDTPAVKPTATNTPTPSAPQPAFATVAVQLDSVDTNDATNNRTPNHTTRHLTVYLYKDNSYTNDPTGNNAVVKGGSTDNIVFTKGDPNTPSTYGTYVNANFSLGNIFPGKYYVFAKTEGSLREALTQTPTLITIDPSQPASSNVLTFTQPLPMGKLIGSDNTVGDYDYNAIVSCYGSKISTSGCTGLNLYDDIFKSSAQIPFADLNDDGAVDGVDYNVLIRNYKHSGL